MITLKTLSWGNCFSYAEDNEIDLSANPITQLVGVNGAGKTSIPLLIQEVLFGKNIRSIKKQDIANRYTGVPGYWINLNFEKYDDKYQVKLQRSKSKLTLTLLKNNLDISSHTAIATYKSISEILGFSDFKMVAQLLYQSSTTNLEFLTATDTNRKRFLVSLLNLSKYLTLHETFKDASREISKDIISAQATLDHVESWIVKHSAMDFTEKEKMEVISIPDTIIDELAEVRSRIDNIKSINKDIVANNKFKADLANIDATVLIEDVKAYNKNAVADINEEIGGLKASSNSAGMTKKTFSSLDGVKECPTCFHKVDTDNISAILKSAEEEIKEYSGKIRELQGELRDWEAVRLEEIYVNKTRNEFVRLNNSIDTKLSEETLDERELVAAHRDLKNELYRLEQDSKEIAKHNAEVSAFNAKISVIQEQLVEFGEDKVKKKRILDKAIEEKSYIEILKNAFSTNGLLSYKIESSVKVLEDSINDYLSEFCFFRLVFVLEGEKLNVSIIDDNSSTIAIESLSTGELARVNISTVLAIRKVMTTLANSNINFLFLDEIVGVLDDAGKEKLSEILIKENLNTFIVSHESTHPLIPKILVEKENNISKLIDD